MGWKQVVYPEQGSEKWPETRTRLTVSVLYLRLQRNEEFSGAKKPCNQPKVTSKEDRL